jgi:PAS domain S-box-containing protein
VFFGPADLNADSRLRQAAERLNFILSSNEIATWTWDLVNDRVIGDENLARLFGMGPEEAAGAPLERYLLAIHPEDRQKVQQAVASAVAESSQKFETDYRVLRGDGSISWLTVRGRVECDAQGAPQHFTGVVFDVTERKTSEQNLEALTRRLEQQSRVFDTTLSAITDFAYIFDREGRFSYVNQALLDLWGLKLEDAVGKNFYELRYPDELAARLQRQIQQVFDTGEGLTDETPYTSPTGAGGYYEYIFRPVLDREGKVQAVAGSTRDISERKRTEDELRQSQERFRVLAESLENQVHERTAELQQRNAEMLHQSDLLRDLSVRLMKLQDEERRRIARELHDSAGQTIALLLINLQQIVRAAGPDNPKLQALAEESGQYVQELNRELRTTSYLLHPPLLDEIGLRAALQWYGEGFGERSGLKVEVKIDDDFARPSREQELAIFRIAQECLTNIHRHSGSKTARILVGTENETIVLEVHDAGDGMKPEELAKIQSSGGGVGLRGMRERVRQFAGNIAIESQPGAGTKIRVTLPQAPSA